MTTDLLENDISGVAEDHENLLGFLYMCPVGVVRMNLKGDIDLANPRAAQYLLALSRRPEMDNFFAAVESCAPELRHMVGTFGGKSGMICEQHRVYVRASGPGVRVLACSMIKTTASTLMAVLLDITQQVEQERQLAQNDVLLDALLAGVNDFSLFGVDAHGCIETWNAAGARQLGYCASEALGKPLTLFFRSGDASRGRLGEQLAAAAQEGWLVQDGWCERRDGSRFSCQVMISVADEPSVGAGFSVVVRDVTERRMTTDELRKLLTTDQMTGAFNRGRFFELARQHMTRCERTSQPLSIIMLDVDHFKTINDNYGHSVGDEVLRRLVSCCKAQLGEGGLLGRLGGEEFGVLLPNTDLEGAKVIAERLRLATAADLAVVGGTPAQTTVSLGCVSARRPMGGIDDLLKAADRALYDAKRAGRNRVCAA